MLKVSHFFSRIANFKTFIGATAIYLFFAIVIMQPGADTISEKAGKKVEIFDLQMSGYSPQRAAEIQTDYTPEARRYAAMFNLVADSFYPFAYTFLYIVLLAWIYKTLVPTNKFYTHIHLLPLSTMLVDYCENTCIIRMMHDYPNVSDALVNISSTFTLIKWGTLAVTTAVVLWGWLLLVYYKLNRARQ